MSKIHTEQMIYTGHVQGVGFRYTVRSLARRLPVGGFVKNLPNGSVEVVAQGTLAAIDSLLSDVAEQFRGNIRHCERRSIEGLEMFEGFEIRF